MRTEQAERLAHDAQADAQSLAEFGGLETLLRHQLPFEDGRAQLAVDVHRQRLAAGSFCRERRCHRKQ